MSEAAGIPEAARQRLQTSPRTSDLSVDELALLETLDIEPLGLVFGSSIYHVGWQRARLFESKHSVKCVPSH